MYLRVNELDYVKSLITADNSKTQEFKDGLINKLMEEEKFLFKPRTEKQLILQILFEHQEYALDMNEANNHDYSNTLAESVLFNKFKLRFPSVEESAFKNILQKMQDGGLIYSEERDYPGISYTAYGLTNSADTMIAK